MKFLTYQLKGPVLYGVLLALCMILTPLYAPASGSDTYKIIERLPWEFKASPVLAGAERITVTLLRATQAVDSAVFRNTSPEIQYHRASYTDRSVANDDFERFLPALVDTVVANTIALWHMVVQSEDRIHWLHGQCVVSKEQFRQIYAALVDQAEDIGPRANRAILCHCGAPCQQVDIDR